jgi:hypothetical protein
MMDLAAFARDVRAALRQEGLPPLPFAAREEPHRVEVLVPPTMLHQREAVEGALERLVGRRVDLTFVQVLGPWEPDPRVSVEEGRPGRASAVRRCVLTGAVVLAAWDHQSARGERWSYAFDPGFCPEWAVPPGRSRSDADLAAVDRGWALAEATEPLAYPTARPLERAGYTFFPAETA